MNEKYKTIVADPPWRYGVWGGNSGRTKICQQFQSNTQNLPLPYPSMSVDEIRELPVESLSDDDCDLYLWTTQKYLPDSFGIVDTWGFKYCALLTWCKTPRGTGQGGLYCPTNEFIVHARKGRMPQGKQRQDSTWWNIPRPNEHSTKPEYFTDLIEAMSDAPRLEMFARRNRLGWSTWGNECLQHVELA